MSCLFSLCKNKFELTKIGQLRPTVTFSQTDLLKFVTPPPDCLQLKCPICLELLVDDPYLVSCCGNHLCGKCIKNILCQPCPLCKSVSLQKVPDKGFQRALSSLSVFCLHKEQGCVWRGGLKQLRQHLCREGDFEYIELTCKHDGCGVVFFSISVERS